MNDKNICARNLREEYPHISPEILDLYDASFHDAMEGSYADSLEKLKIVTEIDIKKNV